MAKPPKNDARRDSILKRMLETPHQPHEPLKKKKNDKKREQEFKGAGGGRRR